MPSVWFKDRIFKSELQSKTCAREGARAAICTMKKSSHEWHGAAGGHNLNRAARVSKRMFGSCAGDLSIDLRLSVIWTYGGKNSYIRLLTRAALLFGRPPKSCQKNKKFRRRTTVHIIGDPSALCVETLPFLPGRQRFVCKQCG
jgi:hypothetical protein